MPRPEKSATTAISKATKADCDYRRARTEFFDRYGARWPGTLADGFDLLAPYVLKRAEVLAIRDAAGAISGIYQRACDLLRRLSDEALLNLAVPSSLIPLVRSFPAAMEGTVIGRLDLVRTDTGYRLMEFNADAPGLIVEAFSINRVACAAAGLEDANAGYENLLRRTLERAVQVAVQSLADPPPGQPSIVVTAFGNRRRDAAAAEYLCSRLRRHSARYTPVEQLQLEDVDVLIRLAPMLLLRNRMVDLVDTVCLRRTAIINAPSSFLLANKALQAVIWKLAETRQFFNAGEVDIIEHYLLPTYFEPPHEGQPYVQKPFYGAEGDTVTVMDAGGRILHRSLDVTHLDGPMVYQQYVSLPAPELMTEFGPRKLHLVTSCFLLAGEPSAICIRAGTPITDDSAWVMPVAVR